MPLIFRNSEILSFSWWLPVTARLWLETASFGIDRIFAEEETIQFSQRLQGLDITYLIVVEEEPVQIDQRF